MLPSSRPFLDAAIDSGGGPLGTQLIRLLRDGAIISCYGQTTMQPLDMPMALVLKNVEIRGASRLPCFRCKTRTRLLLPYFAPHSPSRSPRPEQARRWARAKSSSRPSS